MLRTHRSWISSFVVAVVLAASQSVTRAGLYLVTDLGTLPGHTISGANAINDSGMIAGGSSAASGTGRGFRWVAGVMTELPSLDASPATALGINSLGQIVGQSGNNAQGRATLWGLDNVPVDVSPPDWVYSTAFDINDAGYIVGERSRFQSPPIRGYRRTPSGVFTDFISGGSNTYASAINNAGQAVGAIFSISTTSRIPIDDLGPLPSPAVAGEATDINASGTIVGHSGHAAIWVNREITLLGQVGTRSTRPQAINDADQIVGYSDLTLGVADDRAFIHENGAFSDLTSLIQSNPGWLLNTANDVNNLGQIVGTGVNPAGQTHGYLLTPIPEPGAGVLVAGVAIAAFSRGARRTLRSL